MRDGGANSAPPLAHQVYMVGVPIPILHHYYYAEIPSLLFLPTPNSFIVGVLVPTRLSVTQ